jgi:hypothetical protein
MSQTSVNFEPARLLLNEIELYGNSFPLENRRNTAIPGFKGEQIQVATDFKIVLLLYHAPCAISALRSHK